MDWLIIAFLAPLLWAVSNFIDKFLISKYFKGGTGTLVIYSCLIGIPVSLLILLFKPEVLSINLGTAFLVLLNGFLYISFLFPYFKALEKADTSVVIPMFQTIPVITYILAFFVLGETFTNIQFLASSLIILGAIGISLKFDGRKTRFRSDVVFLMLLASFIVALNSLLFKFFAIELNFWTVSFWQYLGFSALGILLLLFVKGYRKDFLSSFKKNGKKIISLNIMNEVINISAVLIFTFATLLAPLSLIWVINGFQPLFVFLMGLLLTLFLPHLLKEEISKKIILQKIIFIILMLVGAYLLGI